MLDHALVQCQIKRIDDESYRTLGQHSLCITECYGFWRNYIRYSNNEQLKTAPLAFFLAAYECAFGPSDSLFDSYKGAFSFPFAVKILQDNKIIPYLLHVTSWRGSVEFRFFKVLSFDETRYDINLQHKPFEDELSEHQMNVLVNFVTGFAEGCWNTTQRYKDKWNELFPETKQQEFIKAIDSNNILFGYKDGHLFENHYSDQDEYENIKKKLLRPYLQVVYQKRLQETFFDE